MTHDLPVVVARSCRMQGAGVYAGSCDDLTVTEEQITICAGDREPRDLGEPERRLFLQQEDSLELNDRRNAMGREPE